jgi:hypothetical protein
MQALSLHNLTVDEALRFVNKLLLKEREIPPTMGTGWGIWWWHLALDRAETDPKLSPPGARPVGTGFSDPN